ncbi:MAG: AAA family ATPase [Oscillospiraceae bacterium]|nr:AAA family ATPase [Oscillospiraceae bacterium]
MARLKKIKIDTFRGISDLDINDLSHVNLIVGDNNCGKTSILEAIQLLRVPDDITNVFRVSRIRDSYTGSSRMPIFDSFMSMLTGENDNTLSVSCAYENDSDTLLKTSSVLIRGSIKRVLFDINELSEDERFAHRQHMLDPDDNEIDEFVGELISKTDVDTNKKSIIINGFTNVTGREVGTDELINIRYLSPISHITNFAFNQIVKNEKYKKICIRVLKMFDEKIDDLLFLKTEYSYRPVEYVKNSAVGLMPLSTYGDGIKKVLSIANAIAQSAGGILLIDEIETAIHAKYYDEIFKFIIKAAVQYNVQLFITTHSIEAVDGLLNTQVSNGEYSLADELIKVVTLRKDNNTGKTLSRVMTGREVFNKRETFNFEVRI